MGVAINTVKRHSRNLSKNMFKTIILVIMLSNITVSYSSDLNEEKRFKSCSLIAEVKPVTPAPPLRGTWHRSWPPEQQISWRTRNQADVAIMSMRETAPASTINGVLESLPPSPQCPGTTTFANLQFAMTALPSMCLDSTRNQNTTTTHITFISSRKNDNHRREKTQIMLRA